MKVLLVNPSDTAFGTAVITPRWMYVIAAATPRSYGDPVLIDETLERLDQSLIQAGDVVGISIHTANALRGYEIGRLARANGAWVVFGGIHATLYPKKRRNSVARIRWSKETAILYGPQFSTIARAEHPDRPTPAGASMRTALLLRVGTSYHETATCGRRYKQCAAALNTVRSAQCGAPTDSAPDNDLLMP